MKIKKKRKNPPLSQSETTSYPLFHLADILFITSYCHACSFVSKNNYHRGFTIGRYTYSYVVY